MQKGAARRLDRSDPLPIAFPPRSISANVVDKAVEGTIYRTEAGQPSLLAQHLPQIQSLNLHPPAVKISAPDFLKHNRHVERILNPESREPFIVRSALTSEMRRFFLKQNFLEVSTPIMTVGASGANARPFETGATEFGEDVRLNLRVAPELWLKRLLVGGGLERVFEIGPVFRNEGEIYCRNKSFSFRPKA